MSSEDVVVPDEWIRLAHRLADAAREQTVPRFRTALTVADKAAGAFDPVTIADREAERVMREILAEEVPDHGVLGEERELEEPRGVDHGDHRREDLVAVLHEARAEAAVLDDSHAEREVHRRQRAEHQSGEGAGAQVDEVVRPMRRPVLEDEGKDGNQQVERERLRPELQSEALLVRLVGLLLPVVVVVRFVDGHVLVRYVRFDERRAELLRPTHGVARTHAPRERARSTRPHRRQSACGSITICLVQHHRREL